MTREFRVASETWPDADFEIRTTPSGLNFIGYAAMFDSRSEDLGGFRETIAPGAFTRTLSERGRSNRSPIKMFQNHNWDIVLASTFRRAGREPTLRLSEDTRGLIADADLPDNEWGRPIRDAVDRGDISTMSFGFTAVQEEPPAQGRDRRLLEVKLHEVSPVTAWPAYPTTSTSVRRLAELTETPEDELTAVVRTLLSGDDLEPDAHALLIRVVNARFPSPVVDQEVAEVRARLLAKRPEWVAAP